LPETLNESSGIDIDPWGNIWTHNDAGDEPVLYQINANGALIRSLSISNAAHIDWEDISIAPDGYMYIADFGNNNNDREDLRIYKLNLNGLPANQTSVDAEIIEISYVLQNAFPPPAAQRHFDVEAIAYRAGFIYLFTKNRATPNDGLSRIYRVPSEAGAYQITPVMTFFTSTNTTEGRITGADFSDDGSELLLISNIRLWHFKGLNEDLNLNSPSEQYTFAINTQKEAVCFMGQCKILITDEINNSFGGGGKLYEADLCALNTVNPSGIGQYIVHFDAADGAIHIKSEKVFFLNPIQFELFDIHGNRLINEQIDLSNHHCKLQTQSLANGIYLFRLRSNEVIHYSNRLPVRNW
jgi:hypothetical protein